MTYAGSRICFDADSHLMPDADFLTRFADPKLHDALWIGGGKNGGAAFEERFEGMMTKVRARMANPQATATLEENVIASAKGWFAHGAVDGPERQRTLDLLGFHAQLVFSTFAGQFMGADDPELVYGGARAHNRAMAAFCEGDDRLMAVALVPLSDPTRALAEAKAAIADGCSAIHVPSDPAGGFKDGFSPAHVDLEPFYAHLAEAGVPVVLHIGGGRLLPRAYHRNGRPTPTDWLGGGENLRAKDFPAVCHSPQNFLTSLVLDGVFHRHPELRCGVIELGAAWVPGFVKNLDHAFRAFGKNEPLLQELDGEPSDYIRRQVKFTPFPFEDVGWLIEQCGPELFLFSSDYPHPEGSRDPIGKFERSLDAVGVSEDQRTKFYSENFKEMMGL